MSLQGWECPKCGQVYAPFVSMCSNCLPKTNTAPSTNCTCGRGASVSCPIHTSNRPTTISSVMFGLERAMFGVEKSS